MKTAESGTVPPAPGWPSPHSRTAAISRPRETGTIKHVKLVSCKAGKFRLQLAKANPSARKAKIVAKGPEITYAGQSPCGVPAATTSSSRASGSTCMSPRVTTSPSWHDPPERCRAPVATASSCTPRRCPWEVGSRSHTHGPAATSWSSSATSRRRQPFVITAGCLGTAAAGGADRAPMTNIAWHRRAVPGSVRRRSRRCVPRLAGRQDRVTDRPAGASRRRAAATVDLVAER